MNKKNSIFIGIALVVGLVLGYLLFGGSSEMKDSHDHTEDIATADTMWTCSMHPQIMLPEEGDCPICGMDLIPAATVADGLGADQFKMTENAMALANVQTSIVGNSNAIDNVIKLSGKIVENEEANAVQVSYFSGRIERLNVNFTGEKIRKGQLLATIYSPELFAAQQELLTAASLKESQPALYKAVRNKLKLWKLSENQINEIETSGKVKEDFPVYATVSGTVSEKLVEQGDYIKQGQPLLKIANLNTVWANFDVYENQINLVKIGQEVSITTNAYPDKEFKAKVTFIDPILNSNTRTVTLRVVLNNVANDFKPGMFVEGKVKVKVKSSKSSKDQALIIPSTAVLWTGERSIVYIKIQGEEPIFEMREITLGNRMGENYEVISGLSNGDEIVTNGTFTIDAAAQLQGKKSMMNPKGGKTTTGHEGHLGTKNETSENSSSDTNHSEMNKRIKVSNKFQNQFKNVFDEYIKLKNALVEDNAIASKEAANSLVNKLAEVDMKLLKDNEAHKHWMTIEKGIKSSGNAIAGTSDIKNQRDHFKHLSAQMISSIKRFGINQKVYSKFCPMADNDKGAYWLSLEKEIRNPYFGDAMLRCGTIKDTIE